MAARYHEAMGRVFLALVLIAGCLLAAAASRAGQDDPRLDSLFVRLKLAANEEAAARTEADIWHIWVEAKTAQANALMGRGIRAMQAGDRQTATNWSSWSPAWPKHGTSAPPCST